MRILWLLSVCFFSTCVYAQTAAKPESAPVSTAPRVKSTSSDAAKKNQWAWDLLIAQNYHQYVYLSFNTQVGEIKNAPQLRTPEFKKKVTELAFKAAVDEVAQLYSAEDLEKLVRITTSEDGKLMVTFLDNLFKKAGGRSQATIAENISKAIAPAKGKSSAPAPGQKPAPIKPAAPTTTSSAIPPEQATPPMPDTPMTPITTAPADPMHGAPTTSSTEIPSPVPTQ